MLRIGYGDIRGMLDAGSAPAWALRLCGLLHYVIKRRRLTARTQCLGRLLSRLVAGEQRRHGPRKLTGNSIARSYRVIKPWLTSTFDELIVYCRTTLLLSKKTTRDFLSPSAPL